MSASNQDIPDLESHPLPGESASPYNTGEENSPIIYRVPEKLRRINPQACMPGVVSIGPLHHGKQHLQHMEKEKRKYLNYFIQKTGASKDSYTQLVRQNEEKLRACYDETINFNSDKFVEIILVDAAFIIVFLLRLVSPDMRVIDDSIFGKQWKLQEMWLDVLLVENQLPFFILEDLFAHKGKFRLVETNECLSIVDLFCVFFKQLMGAEIQKAQSKAGEFSNIEHFVDFLRRLYLHGMEQKRKKFGRPIPSITNLYQAGVKFEAVSSRNLYELKFENGILKIPKFIVGHETDVSICNLLAFEQKRHPEILIIGDHVALVNLLIQTPEDLELMVREGIVQKDFCNAPFLFHQLSGAVVESDESCCHSLIARLQDHCGKPWPKLRVFLMQKYFNTQWATLSFHVVVIYFILALIQTLPSGSSQSRPISMGNIVEMSQFHRPMAVVPNFVAVLLLIALMFVYSNVVSSVKK